jgi:hypothetical protein
MPTRPKTFKPASSLKVFNAYEANRAPSHKRGYDARWRKLSKWFRMVNPLCALCGAPAEHVDHIAVIREKLPSRSGALVAERADPPRGGNILGRIRKSTVGGGVHMRGGNWS